MANTTNSSPTYHLSEVLNFFLEEPVIGGEAASCARQPRTTFVRNSVRYVIQTPGGEDSDDESAEPRVLPSARDDDILAKALREVQSDVGSQRGVKRSSAVKIHLPSDPFAEKSCFSEVTKTSQNLSALDIFFWKGDK